MMRAAVLALLPLVAVAAAAQAAAAEGLAASGSRRSLLYDRLCTEKRKWTTFECSTQYYYCKEGKLPVKRTCPEGRAFRDSRQRCVKYASWGSCYFMFKGSKLVTNMALSGSTGLSSFPRGTMSYYANDNNTGGVGRPDAPVPASSGFPKDARVTFTEVEHNPYWYTSLMPGRSGEYPPAVKYVRIFAAPGTIGSSMANLEVRVGSSQDIKTDSTGRITNLRRALKRCATMPGRIPSSGPGKQAIVTLKCDRAGNVLAVVVAQKMKAQLALAEVQVFDGPPKPLDD